MVKIDTITNINHKENDFEQWFEEQWNNVKPYDIVQALNEEYYYFSEFMNKLVKIYLQGYHGKKSWMDVEIELGKEVSNFIGSTIDKLVDEKKLPNGQDAYEAFKNEKF